MIEVPEPGRDSLGYKACCAALYESAAIRYLLGDAMRPGGLALTRELLAAGNAAPGENLLDVACGTGDSREAVEALGAVYHGVDLSTRNLGDGGARVAAADTECLPFRDPTFDAVLLQCAYCTFPDKRQAAAELSRVLKPGGRLLLADVTLDCQRLPEELGSVFARIACLADARPMRDYIETFEESGLKATVSEDCPDAARRFLRSVDQKLLVARVAQAVRAADLDGIDIAGARRLLKLGIEMVDRGELSYGYFVAQKA